MNDWEQVAERQAEIINGLSLLCNDLIQELSQYRIVGKEIRKLKSLNPDKEIADSP